METLPLEVLEKIFSYLSLKDQVRCEIVCRRFFNLVTENVRKVFDWRFSVVRFEEYRKPIYWYNQRSYATDVERILVSFSIDNTNKKNFVDVQCNRHIEEAVEYLALRAGDMIKSVSVENQLHIESSTLLSSTMKNRCPNLVEMKFQKEDVCTCLGVASCVWRRPSIVPSLFYHRNLSRLILKDVRIEIPLSIFDDIHSSDVIQLTHLHLERVRMQGAVCLGIFRNCCANLQFLYIDHQVHFDSSATMEECFSYSPNIKNLTFCICPAVLNGAFPNLPNLESLCLGGHIVDSSDVNDIPQEVISKLRNLNVSSYSDVDNSILESLRRRPEEAPMLVVFAFGTQFKVNSESDCMGCNWRVVVDTLPEDGLFYGFKGC